MANLFWLIVCIVVIAAWWIVFTKANQPGWMAIIPILNAFIFLKIAGKPAWWLILLFIPIANIVVGFLATMALAEKFSKSVGFAVGMFLLPFIFYPILAFGDAKYTA